MIGNDIVDLTFASSGRHWKSQRFLDKIFSFEEQEVIAKADNSFRTLWLLWSMKESAYKIHVRQKGKSFFAPKKILCQIHSKTEGQVIIENNPCHTSSRITDKYIYTVARSNTTGTMISRCAKSMKSDYTSQHNESYDSVLNVFADKLNCDQENLAIHKNEAGVPMLYKNNKMQIIPFSITHHGQYYGYALDMS